MTQQALKAPKKKLYRFRASTGRGEALTDDRSGAKLPPRPLGSWVLVGETEISPDDGPRIGFASDEIIKSVERDGFIIWPQKEANSDATSQPSKDKKTK